MKRELKVLGDNMREFNIHVPELALEKMNSQEKRKDPQKTRLETKAQPASIGRTPRYPDRDINQI